jgi:carboxyl-terminal processing protease
MRRGKSVFLIGSIALLSTILVAGLAGQGAKADNLYRNLSLFAEVMSLVNQSYVDPVVDAELIEGAFQGVTDAIDEYSYYIPPDAVALYEQSRPAEGEGVGLVVSKRLGYAYIIAVVEGSPAAEAGIRAGDFIERIDGELTTDMPVWRIDSGLRGRDPVELTIVRSALDERETIVLERGDFEPAPPSLRYEEGHAVVRIPHFGPGTARALAAILEDVREKGVDRLLIDVRGNAEGVIEDAIAAADALLASGVIATLEGRRVEKRVWEAGPEQSFDGEVVVLIDNSTAGGAEIFAAAISRNDRGRTVGIPTYGRAIEQKFVLLPSGGALNITIAHYMAPDGSSISLRGLRPDVQVNRAALMLSEQNGDPVDIILDRGRALLR